MAKKEIKKYVFRPAAVSPLSGQYNNAVSLIQSNKDYLVAELKNWLKFQSLGPSTPPTLTSYPNAAALINSNKNFIKNELIAWISDKVTNAVVPFDGYTYNSTKCMRDIGYELDAYITDLIGAGNAETIRISRMYYLNGVAQLLSPTQELAAQNFVKTLITDYVLTKTTYPTQQVPVAAAQVTTGTAAESGSVARFTTLFNITAGIISGGLATIPTITYNYNATFAGYTYNEPKCERDTGYILDSYIYDMTYGGNSLTCAISSRYVLANNAQLISPTQEAAAHTFLKNLINTYILTNTYAPSYQIAIYQTIDLANPAESTAIAKVTELAGIVTSVITTGLSAIPYREIPTGNILPNTVKILNNNKKFIIAETVAYIQYQIDHNLAPFINFTYDYPRCERDISYIVEGYITDISEGTNAETWFNANRYWENGYPVVDGDRQPEVYAHNYIKSLIDNYILTNTVVPSPYQTNVDQVLDYTVTAETPGATRIAELASMIVEVIQNGTAYLPTKYLNKGYIKIQGRYKQSDFLLATNTSTNQIIYNFADPDLGGTVTYSDAYDEDFPRFVQTADQITTLILNADTQGMSVTDKIQIFVETEYQIVKVNPSASDAMERMKVGLPQSMLDADFEYGLQPTKWQVISTMRNYPAVYEVPGTDYEVVNVVTDASSGTGGVGASLITVTTQTAHGLTVGTPFTIKALANTITGFSRAEGTFLVGNVPSTTTFTYYAKSKVGSSNGQILATSYTQLRKGAFYTGASVGSPAFSMFSNGSSGTLTTSLITQLGATIVGFTGTAPPVGAPLNATTGINTGVQVTSVAGSGGTVASTTLAATAEIGSSTLTVTSTTGIVTGLVYNRGDGKAVVVSNVVGSNVSLNGATTTRVLGANASYTNVVQDGTSGGGTGAIFTISRTASAYSALVTTAGSGYAIGNTITMLGTKFDGVAPTNNLVLSVINATPLNGVNTLDNVSLVGGTGYSTSIAVPTTSSGAGTGATVDITDAGGIIVNAVVRFGGTGYGVGDTLFITGGNNNASIQVATTDPGGAITGVNISSGTPITPPTVNFISSATLSEAVTAEIASATGLSYSAIGTALVTFASPHGFIPGDAITVDISSSGTNHQLIAGPYYVEAVPSSTTLRYTARTVGTVDVGTTIVGNVYARPDSYYVHRPFDGGVQLGTGGPAHGAGAVRMSKKYIRYQSGKGVMYNTGALFAPSYDIRSLTATGTAIGSVITLATDDTDHGCQVGAQITVSGATTSGYNGVYTVTEIVDERTLKIVASKTLGATSAVLGNPCQMAIRQWHGATVRAGTFDDQNGMFWQYDGQRLSVVRRSSTFQMAGTISVNANSNTVTGSNTRFTEQCHAGDRVVIRGMSHTVTGVANDTTLYIAPDYRGRANLTNAKMCLTVDLQIPQEYFNNDTGDGKGPSGYNIDITKMQMIGMQWTWYGAGFIDFMLRGADGGYTYLHRIRNSNVNTEAYMRTGNMPVRYEVTNEGAKDRLAVAMNASQTTLDLDDAYWFPNNGTVYVDNELISYTSKVGNQLRGLTRGAQLTQFVAGSQRNFTAGAAASHAVRSGVVLVSNTVTPIISHWGSAFMTDGRFDSDRGYIFNYAATNVSISTTKQTAFLLRLAPSVSNAITGDLGDRELINRAQLLLQGIEITSDTGTGGIVIEGVLNPQNYPTDPANISWSGLQNSAAGGQPSFAQVSLGGSVTWNGSGPTSTTAITTQSNMTNTIVAQAVYTPSGTLTSPGTNGTFTGQNKFYILGTNYTAYTTNGIAVGDAVSGSGFPANTTITAIASSPTNINGTNYYAITISSTFGSTTAGNVNVTVTRGFKTSATNVIFFPQTTWAASGATAGQSVSDSLFPAGTSVSSATLVTFFTTTYYRVQFTQTSTSATITPGTTGITFVFGLPAYALPGETVFSFVAAPGGTQVLDLSELKELTNTAIGGRGTFPNGPDVLALNVYKTSGSAINSNIVLRWGEAQA